MILQPFFPGDNKVFMAFVPATTPRPERENHNIFQWVSTDSIDYLRN